MSIVGARVAAGGRRRRWLVALAAICTGAVVLAAYWLWPELQMRAAYSHLRAGRLVQAHALAERVLANRPQRSDAHLLLARTLRMQREPQKALGHVWDAARTKPQADGLRREYALCLAALGQHAEAQPMLQEIFQSGTCDSDVIEALSRYAIESFQFERAMEYINAWNSLSPRDTRVLMLRAEVAKRMLRHQEGSQRAIADYRQVLQINPQHLDARMKLGEELFANGQMDEAAGEFERCRAQDPENVEPVYKLALCREDKLEEAEQLLLLALDRQPEHANALVALSKIEINLGKTEQAIDRLSRLVERQPYHDKARYGLFLALRYVGREADAAEQYAEWQRLKSGLNEMSGIIEQIQRAPENMALRYRAGKLLMEYGLEEEGARWLATIVEIDPGHTEARRALAEYQARVRSGSNAAAVQAQKQDDGN